MPSKIIFGLAAGIAALLLQAAADPARAGGGAAIAGQVNSEAEGAMEGVVVTAKKAGAKVSTSVITNAEGRYSFPADRLEPGQYALTIRAVGYDLEGKPTADVVVEATATANLRLAKTKNLAAQLSHAE